MLCTFYIKWQRVNLPFQKWEIEAHQEKGWIKARPKPSMANTKLYHCIPGIWDCNRIIGTPKDLSLHHSSSFILHTAQTISFVGQLSSVTTTFNGSHPTVLEFPISCDPNFSLAPPSHFHATSPQVFVRNKYRSRLYSFRSLVYIMPIKLELHGKQLPA